MNRSFARIAIIVMIFSSCSLVFGQGYYGNVPTQASPYGGYGEGYAVPGYGQTATPAYPMAPPAQQMQASPYGTPYQGATPYQPYAQPQYGAPGQYQQAMPGANPYEQYPQAAPGSNPYAAYPQAGGGDPSPPQEAEYYVPGALIQNEIYWDPNYDRAVAHGGQAPVEVQPQYPQQPVAAAARPANQERTMRQNQNQPRNRGQAVSARKKKSPASQQGERVRSDADRPTLQWGAQAEPKASSQNPTTMRWGQTSRQQPTGDERASSGIAVRNRTPQQPVQESSSGRLPWGSN